MKIALLSIASCFFFCSCAHEKSPYFGFLGYEEVVLTPEHRSETECLDVTLIKISKSGMVTIKTTHGIATGKEGEMLTTVKGEKLWRIKSVNLDTGKVVLLLEAWA